MFISAANLLWQETHNPATMNEFTNHDTSCAPIVANVNNASMYF